MAHELLLDSASPQIGKLLCCRLAARPTARKIKFRGLGKSEIGVGEDLPSSSPKKRSRAKLRDRATTNFRRRKSSPEINADVGETEARAHTTDSADNPASAPSVPWSKVDVTPSHEGQGSGNGTSGNC